jgi:hypothetical protein
MTQSLDYNRIGLDYRLPMPRPKVNGIVIDCHVHLLSRRHCPVFFEAADHYGIDCFVSMTPLEEAIRIQRDYPGRVRFIAVPSWGDKSSNWIDNWRRHIDAFYNLGSRIVKFHLAPGSMQARKVRLDEEPLRSLVRESVARGMIIMTHIGDPETWYRGRYADAGKFGTRDEHYRMWESVLSEYPNHPWLGAHLGGNPEDLPRLQRSTHTPSSASTRRPPSGSSARSPPGGTPRASSSSATRIGFFSDPTRSAPTTAASTSSPAASGATENSGKPPTAAKPPSTTPTARTISNPF